ncbi:MAG TPA: HIT domain-containing protein [Bacillota bacterium]|nr:HIT domain-containing protein [Bacillota bacterium]
MGECLFCKIIAGEIPSQKVFENDKVVVIKDIKPVAPVHLLVLPKIHVANVCDPKLLEGDLLAALYGAIGQVSFDLNLRGNGFRVVSNYGRDAGETIPHFHIHILAGRMLEGMG